MVALVAALARLDEHHGPAEAFAVRASKGHVSCAGATWRAAAAVPAYSTVVGPIQASAPTAGIRQTMWLWGLMGARALPSFLDRDGHGAAGPNVAQARLLDHLTVSIVICNARRNAHPTAPGTLGPGSGLNHALITCLLPGCQVLVSTWLAPLASGFHQFVAKGILLLFVFVSVKLPVRLWKSLRVGIHWVGNERRVRRVSGRLGSAIYRGHDCGSLVAVDAEAALAGHLDQLRGRAGRRRQGHVAGAKRHAPYRSIDASALVLATSSEVLAVLINPTTVFTGAALGLCPADAMGSAHIIAIIALQSFMVVARAPLMAVLV